MKKLALLLSVVALMALSACGNANDELSIDDEGTTETAASEPEAEPTKDTAEEPKETGDSKEEPKVKESKIGKLTLATKKKGIDKTVTTGPFKITVLAAQTATLEPSQSYIEMFDGKKKTTIVTLKVKVENTKDIDAVIYPSQGTLTTSTGKQADAKIFMSDDLGGEFFGKVSKKGNVIFQVNGTKAADISKVTYIVGAPSDTEFNSLGEQVKIEVPIK